MVYAVQDMLGSSGSPPQFVWRGKTYSVGFPDDRAKARLEELVIQAETAAVVGSRALLPPDEYRAKVDRLARQNRARDYRTRGPLWLEYMAGESRAQGFTLYVQSLLNAHHPEVTDRDVEEMLDECGEFLALVTDRVVPDFFGLLAALAGLPPERTAAALAETQEALRRLRTPTSSTA